ncbi:MAG: LEA type 2 family protein [Pseudomonadales bacterium]
MSAVIRLCFLSLLIAGCATMRPNFETPDIHVTSFSMLPSTGLEARFKIGLRVTNPNAQALNVRGIKYNVSLEGFEFIRGVGNDIPTIPGYGEEEFFVEASTNLIESIKMITSFINNPKDKLTYAFGAKLDLGSSILPALNLTDTGEINLTQGE